MIFDRNQNKEVIALLGAGSMGTASKKRIIFALMSLSSFYKR